MGFLISLLVLSFLIFFHELGHFLAARLFGVKVEVFSIGFGKKIYTKVCGGTEYALSAIPLGGYVKMKGQDDSDPTASSTDRDSYNTKPSWQRLIILAAGSFANLFLAFLLYLAIALLGVQTLLPIVGDVNASMPAYAAGLREGDEIVRVNGERARMWDEVSSTIKKSQGPVEIEIVRGGQEATLLITPAFEVMRNIFGEEVTYPVIGIRPKGEIAKVSYPLIEAFPKAFFDTIGAGQLIIRSVEKLITGVVAPKEVGGIISIMQVTSKASESGIITLFFITALISVNLGILNLLPIPALDGGHILFTLYEMIAKRPPSPKALFNITVVGWVILGLLMLLGLYNDLMRLSQGFTP